MSTRQRNKTNRGKGKGAVGRGRGNRKPPKQNQCIDADEDMMTEHTVGGYGNQSSLSSSGSNTIQSCLKHDHKHKNTDGFQNQAKKRRAETSTPFQSTTKKTTRFENPEKMGSRRLIPSKNVDDIKDKHGASIAFRDKYNQYLDSRTRNDDLDIELVKNLPMEDLYSRNEDDMSDDEKQARFYFDTNVDDTVDKYMKMFKGRHRETLSSVENRKQLERKKKEEEKMEPFYVSDDGEYDIGSGNNNRIEMEGTRANCTKIEKTVILLKTPFLGSASSLSLRDFVKAEINTNPYPFFSTWREMQGKSVGNYSLTIVCVQMDYIKTHEEGFRIFKKFVTSRRYLTLIAFFDRLKPMTILSSSAAKKRLPVLNDKQEVEEEGEGNHAFEKLDETSKNDAIRSYNDMITRGCEFNVKQTYQPTSFIFSNENWCNIACTMFEKSFLSEDLTITIYVYYKLDLNDSKISIVRIFHVLSEFLTF